MWGGSAARFSSELGEKASGTVYGPKTPMLLNGDPRNGVLACSQLSSLPHRRIHTVVRTLTVTQHNFFLATLGVGEREAGEA